MRLIVLLAATTHVFGTCSSTGYVELKLMFLLMVLLVAFRALLRRANASVRLNNRGSCRLVTLIAAYDVIRRRRE